jgi:hypothetical protein
MTAQSSKGALCFILVYSSLKVWKGAMTGRICCAAWPFAVVPAPQRNAPFGQRVPLVLSLSTNQTPRAILNRFAFHRRNRLLRLAILLIALLQVGTRLVPHTGSLSGATSARTHLHAPGDPLELAHDETACPACSGLQVNAWVTAPTHARLVLLTKVKPIYAAQDRPAFSDHASVVYSRGPPSLS